MAKKKTRKDGLRVRTFTYEGKRYYIYGKTNKELNDKEYQKRQELAAGTLDRENPTLNRYYDHFTEIRRGSVREGTMRIQAGQFRVAAAIPIDGNGKTFGELQIRDVTPRDVQRVQRYLADSGRNASTVNGIMQHVKHVFNTAMRDETIEKNPCVGIVSLKKEETPVRETIHRALSQEETRKFFEAARARNSHYYNVFALMIQTGMRFGEVGALMAFDVDEKAGVIHIRRTITRDEGGSFRIGDGAKTKTSVRDIPLTSEILKLIKEQIDINRSSMLWSKLPGTIFTTTEGHLLEINAITREIKRCCEAAGIERFSSHAFRATFATRFIEQRPEDYKTLSEILGHADISITLNLYTHVMEDRKRTAMNNVSIKLG